MKSFEKSRSLQEICPPKLDIGSVFWSPMRALYEPLCEFSYKDLTLKSFILLGLAEVKHLGELLGLIRCLLLGRIEIALILRNFWFCGRTENLSVPNSRVDFVMMKMACCCTWYELSSSTCIKHSLLS